MGTNGDSLFRLRFNPGSPLVRPSVCSAMAARREAQPAVLQEQGLVLGRTGAAVQVVDGLIVTGGCLRKPWAILHNASGVPAINLSSNNYDLALFLFGKVNKAGCRNLLNNGNAAKFIRSVWRARNKAQEEVDKELSGGQQDEAKEETEGATQKCRKRKAPYKPNKAYDPIVWDMFPYTFPIEVTSCAVPDEVVKLLVLKGHPNSSPVVVASEDALQMLFRELSATVDPAPPLAPSGPLQQNANSSSGVDAFCSPPRQKRKRQMLPFGLSPDAASSAPVASSSGKKSCTSSALSLLRASRRISVRYREFDGTRRFKSFPFNNPDDLQEVRRVTKIAERFLEENHYKPES